MRISLINVAAIAGGGLALHYFGWVGLLVYLPVALLICERFKKTAL